MLEGALERSFGEALLDQLFLVEMLDLLIADARRELERTSSCQFSMSI